MLKKFLITTILSCVFSVSFAAEQYLPGGYSPADIKSQEVQDAAKFAIAQMQQGTLVKIVSAQSQVVAGMNYALQLVVAANDGTNHLYNVIVFVPLPNSGGTMQLTNVQDTGTVDAATMESLDKTSGAKPNTNSNTGSTSSNAGG